MSSRCHHTAPGKYRIWVRYVDHRKKTEPFTVAFRQGDRTVKTAELGVTPVVPVNDEYQLYWGFSFGWGSFDAELVRGPARVRLVIDKAGEAWRQIDAVLLTDDLAWTPVGREKPPFAYLAAMNLRPTREPAWRGSGKQLLDSPPSSRPVLAGRDFTLWTGAGADPKWWKGQKLPTLTRADVFYQFSPPADIRKEFHKQYPQPRDAALINWPDLLPGFYLGESPDLSPDSPLRNWLEQSKTPFYMMTNYAAGAYTDKNGPATYAALTGPLAPQFLGYIHGEAIGTVGVAGADKPLGKTPRRAPGRAEQATPRPPGRAVEQNLQDQGAGGPLEQRHPLPVGGQHRPVALPARHGIARGRLRRGFDELSCADAYRLRARRGAAVRRRLDQLRQRQLRRRLQLLQSGTAGAARAKSWFHSKYAVTDGVSACWYRKLYYLNYLGGASAVFWEQNLANQWILPGPGTHPIQLSPFGRATEDFQAFVSRLPDRGEPVTPIAFLLSHAHGYEPVNYRCQMLNAFPMSRADLELRELFNVCWYPAGVAEGKPAAPDVQSMPSGVYGNIFDVLVDRPQKARAIFHYPVVWLAGDVDLNIAWPALLEEYVRKGGTLVLTSEAARALPTKLLGLRPTGKTVIAEEWRPEGGDARSATPFEVSEIERDGATVLAWAAPKTPLLTRHAVGEGAVVVALVPRLLGQDERAHPVLPYLMNGLTANLLPVEVRRADGTPLDGEVMYQVNKTKDGYLVLLVNNRGVDKTQNGVARVDRRAVADVVVRVSLPVKSVREYTEPRDLTPMKGEVHLRVHPGDVQVVSITVAK